MYSVTVRLRTLCGCVQYRTRGLPLPSHIDIGIRATQDDQPHRTRRFTLVRFHPADDTADADYEEEVAE